jgi:hypothetical protein
MTDAEINDYATQKTKPARDWQAKRPRWHVHFTPTGASWINQVERFFALLTDKQIRRGAHRSTTHLEAAIRAFIDAHNADPRPFRWTKSADDILAAIQRFCLRTRQIGGTTESRNYALTGSVAAIIASLIYLYVQGDDLTKEASGGLWP